MTETLPQKVTQVKEKISEWPFGDELMGEEEGEQEENGDSGGQKENEDEENGNGNELPDDAGGMIFQIGITIVDVVATFGLIIFRVNCNCWGES